MESCTGPKQFETYQIAIWIINNKPCFRHAQKFTCYIDFIYSLVVMGINTTPCGVRLVQRELDFEALDALIVKIAA